MISTKGHPRARQYIEDLAAAGRYHFDLTDVKKALGVAPPAVTATLHRLSKQGLIASPANGFYVIVPPEYRSLSCLPADQFIHPLMERQERSYYAGLLTAAQYHGAAHQRPQEFQVFVDRKRRSLTCGKVKIVFMLRRRINEVPVAPLNTPRGTFLVSTPEATAIDLIGYQDQAGGFDQAVTVISELAERLRPDRLPAAAATAPIAWGQRLGYILERVSTPETTVNLKQYVQQHARESTSLIPGLSHVGSERDRDWKLWINADVEPEL